jgi:hypothetical protein
MQRVPRQSTERKESRKATLSIPWPHQGPLEHTIWPASIVNCKITKEKKSTKQKRPSDNKGRNPIKVATDLPRQRDIRVNVSNITTSGWTGDPERLAFAGTKQKQGPGMRV